MQKYTTVPKLIEITEFNLDAFSHGFELLALNKQLNPNALTPTELISSSFNGADKEPYEWLRDVIRHLIVPNVELIGQNTICNCKDLLTFMETLDNPEEEALKESILNTLNEQLSSDLDYFDDLSLDMIDNYITNNNIRVTTIASTFFDTDFEFMINLDDALPYITSRHLDLERDRLWLTATNLDASKAYHKSSKYKHSYSIITIPSNIFHSYSICESIYETSERVLYLDSFKEVYKSLLSK